MKTQIINHKIISIFLSSLFMGFAHHSLNLGFLAWFALIPFIYILDNQNSFYKILFYSFLWGFSYHLFTVFWLAFNVGTSRVPALISMLLSVLVLCTNTIFIGAIWFKISKYFKKNNLLFLPIIWVAIEFIRTYGILGFPWVSLANTQIDYLYLIQNAEYVGIYGITFWVVLINVLIYQLYFRNYDNYVLLLIVFLFPFISGYFLLKNVSESLNQEFKISIIQPNINLISKRDYNKRYENLDSLIYVSKKCINDGSKLIIWPESALPFNNIQNPKTLSYITDNLFIDNKSYLITGNVIYNGDKHYNSSVLLNKDGIVNIYNKQQLVPVAEYVPLSNQFPILKTFNLGQANFSKGEKDVLFEINNKKCSSLICFESTFPEINRRYAKLGANFFTYIVNDGWYTTPPEPQQHFMQSIYRAIENRKTVLRCANTGISAVIDPSGRVRKSLDLNKKGVINSFIKETNKSTFYTNYGNVFAIIMLIIMSLLLFIAILKNDKKY